MGRAVVGDVVGRAVSLGLVLLVAGLDLGFYAVLGAAAGGALGHARRHLVADAAAGAGAPAGASRAVWRGAAQGGVPLGLALAINALYFRADTLIISLYEPYGQVGLYTLAYRVLELALVVGHGLPQHAPSRSLSEAVARDEARARRAIEASTEVCVVLGAPLVAGGLVLAPQIIELAGGDDFQDAAEPLRILLAAGALAWVNGVFGYALIARERQASALWLNLSGARLQRRPQLPADPALRDRRGGDRHRRVGAADPGRLLLADAALLRLLPDAAHAGAGGAGRGGDGRAAVAARRRAAAGAGARSARRSTAGCCGRSARPAASWSAGCGASGEHLDDHRDEVDPGEHGEGALAPAARDRGRQDEDQ